eukprot:7386585-Prymnesium_polylepis.2
MTQILLEHSAHAAEVQAVEAHCVEKGAQLHMPLFVGKLLPRVAADVGRRGGRSRTEDGSGWRGGDGGGGGDGRGEESEGCVWGRDRGRERRD